MALDRGVKTDIFRGDIVSTQCPVERKREISLARNLVKEIACENVTGMPIFDS